MKIKKTPRQELISQQLIIPYLCHDDDSAKKINDISSYVINLDIPKDQSIKDFFDSDLPIFVREDLVDESTYNMINVFPFTRRRMFLIPKIHIPKFDISSSPEIIYFNDDQDFKKVFKKQIITIILTLINKSIGHPSFKELRLHDFAGIENIDLFIVNHINKILSRNIRRKFYITETIDRKDVFYAVNMLEDSPIIYPVAFSLLAFKEVECGIINGIYNGSKTFDPTDNDFYIKRQSLFGNPFVVIRLTIDYNMYQKMNSPEGYFHKENNYYIFHNKEDAQRFSDHKKPREQ